MFTTSVNNFFATYMGKSKAAELLELATSRLGSLKAVCDKTGLDKSTLLRIKSGETGRPQGFTLGMLTRAAYGE